MRYPAAILTALLATLPAGCSSSGPHTTVDPDDATTLPALERDVYPFVVTDSLGEIIHPFVGGFDLPRIQFADIDGDGDEDLFVQEVPSSLMYFENTGNRGPQEFRWRTDSFDSLDVGEWTRFIDGDGDGDLDILAERPFSYITYYRNDEGPGGRTFVMAADTVRDHEGEPIYADRQNIPSVTDLDNDGLLDLFIGSVAGTVSRYEQVGVDESVPVFKLLSDRFEDIEIISQFGSLHGANAMAFGDIDRDGDVDLFWGDFFEPGLLLLRNSGSSGGPDLRQEPQPFPVGDPISTSGYNAPVLVDLDQDDDPDMVIGVLGGAFNPIVTSAANTYYLENVSDTFVLRTKRFIRTIDIGSDADPALGDIDGDGDIDMLVGNKVDPGDMRSGRTYLYRNTGSQTEPAFRFEGKVGIADGFHQSVELGDINDDGAPDLFLGEFGNTVRIYLNRDGDFEGAPLDVQLSVNKGSHTSPAVGDIDGDGDLDLIVGEASGELNLFLNTGTPGQARFELQTSKFAGIDVGRRSAPAIADVDGDGIIDLLVGSDDGAVRRWTISVVGDSLVARPVGVLVESVRMSAPVVADLDSDGVQEVVVGSRSGGLVYYTGRSQR